MNSRWAALGMSIGLTALLAGCMDIGKLQPTASETSQAPAPSETTGSPILGPLGAPGCAPASPLGWSNFEVRGTPTRGGETTTLYGLLMLQDAVPVRTGEDFQVVWRMPGDGELQVRVLAPDGRKTGLMWGPAERSASNYLRPESEWGTGFNLGVPGCWEVELATDTTAASVWIEVAP